MKNVEKKSLEAKIIFYFF